MNGLFSLAASMSRLQALPYVKEIPMRQIPEAEVSELSSVLRSAEGRLHRLIEEGEASVNDIAEHQRLVRAINQLEHPSYARAAE